MRHFRCHEVLVAGLAVSAFLNGCATTAVWDKWKAHDEITAMAIRLQSASPADVHVGWRGVLADGSDFAGTLKIEPSLGQCDTVGVLVARRSGSPLPLTDQEQTFEANRMTTPQSLDALWSSVEDPECKVLLVFRRLAEPNVLGVSASWQPTASFPLDTISAPRQVTWLALLPLAVMADAVGTAAVIPLVVCASNGDACMSTLNNLANGGVR